jgi:hypothetical protein
VLHPGSHCNYEQADLNERTHECVKVRWFMSPRTRFQILFESEQLAVLRWIQERTTAPVASQIRRAVENWIAEQGEKPERKRPASRGRSQPVSHYLLVAPAAHIGAGASPSGAQVFGRAERLRCPRRLPASTRSGAHAGGFHEP